MFDLFELTAIKRILLRKTKIANLYIQLCCFGLAPTENSLKVIIFNGRHRLVDLLVGLSLLAVTFASFVIPSVVRMIAPCVCFVSHGFHLVIRSQDFGTVFVLRTTHERSEWDSIRTVVQSPLGTYSLPFPIVSLRTVPLKRL